jgi:hypothetical protein
MVTGTPSIKIPQKFLYSIFKKTIKCIREKEDKTLKE